MRTLLIDNYDSFTYNLFQLLGEVNGVEPVVVRNDEASWEELAAGGFEAIVISPGPGRPERKRDFGVCAEAIRRATVPLLGVCLGHQGLGWLNGGRVGPAPLPMHGRVSGVEHSGSPLFGGIPSRFEAVRYHSLCLERPLPASLEEIAWTEDGVTMAVAHRHRPQWGVQFHPESVAGEHGPRLLANFRDLAGGSGGSKPSRGVHRFDLGREGPRFSGAPGLELRSRRLDLQPDSAGVFADLYGESRAAFWLDSMAGEGGRFSFMGDSSGPLGAVVTYDVATREVRTERAGRTEVVTEPIFDHLERELSRLRPSGPHPAVPFDFDCGFAGYLGYEVKADCGATAAHRSPHPDAAFVFADRLLAFDHELGRIHLLCLVPEDGEEEAEAWLAETGARLEAIATGGAAALPSAPAVTNPPEFQLARSRQRYLEDIAVCKQRLAEGETYEACLTNSLAAEAEVDPLSLYMELRRANPAPFASYLRVGELAVLSSSPERFLRITADGVAEAKPIKGTSRRDADPAEDGRLACRLRQDEKTRAENLMIVDLLRNDLGAVCEIGSVEVPALMEVESFATVHQLVSTVRGRLREGAGALDCVRACFPPGSMTGAPKLRTMEILDVLEGAARGVYSGAIGYFGLGGGSDLSVTIRTVVLAGGRATIGTGGAIVMQSDAQNELTEAFLKAAAPLAAFGASSLQ
jgi:para-aminobenzoate synthetase